MLALLSTSVLIMTEISIRVYAVWIDENRLVVVDLRFLIRAGFFLVAFE